MLCGPLLLEPCHDAQSQTSRCSKPRSEVCKGSNRSLHPQVYLFTQVYIYSESYGGKMAAQFALAIHRAQQMHHIYLTFRSDCLPYAVRGEARLRRVSPAQVVQINCLPMCCPIACREGNECI